jgi:integrase
VAKHKLTDGFVEELAAGKDRTIWDSDCARFGVRVTPAGKRLYVIQYRAKGAPGPSVSRKLTIGEHDGKLWNATKARAAARRLLGAVDVGGDPLAERQARVEATMRARADAKAEDARTKAEAAALERDRFEAVAGRYMAAALDGKRSARETARLLRQGPIAAWAGRHIGAIRRLDVAELIDAIRQRSPATARLTYASLRGLFRWCIERELVSASPCDYVKPPPRPTARDRVLSDAELAAIWRGACALGYPFGPIVKLLMLTGQREAEVAGMHWGEIDLALATWAIPKERTKNNRGHLVHLSRQALTVIKKEVPGSGELLFPARKAPPRKYPRSLANPVRPVTGFSAAKRLLDGDVARKTKPPLPSAGLAPWRFHDLRRTAATRMAAAGVPPHVVERVLNHVSGVTGGLVGVYQHHEYRLERAAALEAWGARLAEIVKSCPLNVPASPARPSQRVERGRPSSPGPSVSVGTLGAPGTGPQFSERGREERVPAPAERSCLRPSHGN